MNKALGTPEVRGSFFSLGDGPAAGDSSVVLVEGACLSDTTGDACTEFSNTLDFWILGNITDQTLSERITEAFYIFSSLLTGISGIKNLTVVNVEKSSGGTQVISNQNAAARGLSVPGIVGAAAGALAFVLLILLLVRRRRNQEEVSHLKLEEEGEDTFIREFETTASSPSRDGSPYKSKKAHVVGEEDSIFSGWTGYTKRGGNEGQGEDMEVEGVLGMTHGDVHVCSSATCEVCERRRQQGVQFVPTGTPPRPPTLPHDAARDYVAEDTVEL